MVSVPIRSGIRYDLYLPRSLAVSDYERVRRILHVSVFICGAAFVISTRFFEKRFYFAGPGPEGRGDLSETADRAHIGDSEACGTHNECEHHQPHHHAP